MPFRELYRHPGTHREPLSRADPGRAERVQVETGVTYVGPGWKNRPISEKPKVHPHADSPYRHGTAAHWGDLLSRTLPGRLALLLAAVILLGVITSTIGHFVLGAHPSFGESLWEALAHMIDPGQIGDDVTGAERMVGVTQVLIGIVFLAGIVLTVLTEVVDRALTRLQQGDPAVREQGHLLLIGMSPTLAGIRELLSPDPDGVHPPVVVMLPPVQSEERHAARQALSGYPGRAHVVVADPRSDGYTRACAGAARHIVLLSPGIEADRADLEVTTRAALLQEHLDSVGESPPVAVELRRGRNTDALWYRVGRDDREPVPRFPPSFDALVIDRNIGALLSLVALNPQFSGVFLNPDGSGPELMAAGDHAGKPFLLAREEMEGASLVGILKGVGPAAEARYLPGPEERIAPADRLIVIRDDSNRAGGDDSGAGPESVKVAPTRPGTLLVLGFSDAAGALLEFLDRAGFDPGRITFLGSRDSVDRPGFRIPPDVGWIEGDPGDLEDIAHAVGRSDPGIIFAAASPGREAEAVISGRLARRQSDAPIVVEQPDAVHDTLDFEAERITVVSTTGLTAEAVALSLNDPALVVARESMLTDPALALESLTYTGNVPLPLADVPAIFGQAGYYPLAVSLGGPDDGGLAHGDHVLAMRRVAPAEA